MEKSIKDIVRLINQINQKYHTRVFLVGGSVRDLVMLKQKRLDFTKDLDIAVENHHTGIGLDLAHKLHARIIHYPQFMTMTLQIGDKAHIDIAQTRKEIYSKPAALPKVQPASIREDLYRRDFTVNAMAMQITGQPPYPMLDPFNGQKDLKLKLIRVLHPKSFIDDPTRIFRAIRFATRFNFKIEKKTAHLLKYAVKKDLLKLLSGERILYELQMINKEKRNTAILKKLQQTGIIKNLFGIVLTQKFFLNNALLESDKKLIYLFSHISKSKLSKYPLTKTTTDAVRALRRFSEYRSNLIKAKKPSEIYTVLNPLSQTALEILSVTQPKPVRDKIKLYLNKYSKVKIFTTGKSLASLKIEPGPKYTKIMKELLNLKLDGQIKTRSAEIKYTIQKYKHA